MGSSFSPYSHVARVKASEFLFIAGQVSTDDKSNIVGADDFDEQCRQVFANIQTALASEGADWSHVFQFTSYLVDPADIPRFHTWRVQELPKLFGGKSYPTNTLLIVDRLVRPEFRVEVQAIAAI
ncbi:MAG: RidA family protein [Pigmentiphaga sp.]